MPHRTFFAFMGPSLVAMLLFIALPIVSIIVQSLYIEHPAVIVSTETCQPFGGCTMESRVDTAATEQLRADQPLGQFNGFGTYIDRAHLATGELAQAWSLR
jgi:ABC-type sugar transport system permease subunit